MEVLLARALVAFVASASMSGAPSGAASTASVTAAAQAAAVSVATPALTRPRRRLAERRREARERGPKRPNIVFILTDDLSWNLVRFMPNVLQMRREGMTFTNYFVTDSLCCPSRASIFTGRYPHNHRVLTNTPPSGGFKVFQSRAERRTFATVLEGAGYRTALMGKYLNGYHVRSGYVPPGWRTWQGTDSGYRGFNYLLSVNGRTARFGRSRRAYVTDVLSRRGSGYIRRATPAREPFAIEIATFAPHKPYVPAPRHRGLFPGQQAPRDAAYNARVVNAPEWLRGRPPLEPWRQVQLDSDFRRRAQSVQAVDEMIGRVRRTLRRRGLADNTYLVFSSDNGYHLGQRRLLAGKMTPYDSDVRVPLVVVGPGVAPGSETDALVENVDLAPTFMRLGGARVPRQVDGQSIVRLLRGRAPRRWRSAVLIEHHRPPTPLGDPDAQTHRSGNPPSYNALRTKDELYVEYVTGDREFYDMRSDPDQLVNRYDELSREQRERLSERLAELESCSGASCRRAATR